jgi:hypothetical protein
MPLTTTSDDRPTNRSRSVAFMGPAPKEGTRHEHDYDE